jgi:hypothetical protein
MMLAMKRTLSLSAFLGLSALALAQSFPVDIFKPPTVSRLVVMQPTGEQVDRLPLMQAVPDTAGLYRETIELVERSFMGEVIDLYFMTQNYLVNTGRLPHHEPAYMALTQEQGGFARTGFYLLENGRRIDKRQVRYVDIIEKSVREDPARLMSITQLYPHEMGHLIYGLLSSDTARQSESRQVDIHYFPIITDYATAFSEGFAEHFENAARLYEPDDAIKAGIFADIEQKKKQVQHPGRALARDYLLPFRPGFYRASMILWYQKLEDLRRYTQAMDMSVRLKNAALGLKHQENELSFRNSGVRQQGGVLRNRVQALATEGVIDAFFTQILLSDLPKQYQPPAFYRPFMANAGAVVDDPAGSISPFQNQCLKNFYVLHDFVNREYTERSQLTDFIDGYIATFPGEASQMLGIFQEVTGLEYTNELPPGLWLLVKDHVHRLLVLDQFGALTVPVYSFMLNAAEPEDLVTIPGIDRKAARTIVDYRETHGPFQDLAQIGAIPGLSAAAAAAVQNCAFDEHYFNDLPEPELHIQALILTPLKQLLLRGGMYYIFIFSAWYLIYFRKESPSPKRIAGRGVLNFLYWLFFLAAGLAALVFYQQQPLLVFVPFWLSVLLLQALLFRKHRQRRRRALAMSGLMGILIIYFVM